MSSPSINGECQYSRSSAGSPLCHYTYLGLFSRSYVRWTDLSSDTLRNEMAILMYVYRWMLQYTGATFLLPSPIFSHNFNLSSINRMSTSRDSVKYMHRELY